eukprot:gnl/TRDRNA2_/TRDRNA2_173515_c0_seq1.p1 gnl/TRDRNA2_/TRDRNA2_173515_c0~~gnl/TRDRNA2_/TRDRNA2_173515_c0_seq1.p1  ORF type:complete len:347 (-),score=61.51 gnl/TRDRNA2_/TRDRNA2_173515_c0_seq1:259-1269(-)
MDEAEPLEQAAKRPRLEQQAEPSSDEDEPDEVPVAPPPAWLPFFDFAGDAADAFEGMAEMMGCFDVKMDEADLTPEAFGMHHKSPLKKSLASVRAELITGVGLALIRGISWPSDPTLRRSALLLFCAGLRMRPAPQSTDLRELVADVRPRLPDEAERDRLYRGYRNAQAQKLHTDSNRPSTFGTAMCDVLAMLCVQPSGTGGNSMLLSAKALHSTIESERPDLYTRLCGAWPWAGKRDWMPEWGPQCNHEGLPLLSGGKDGVRHGVQYGKILRENVEAGFANRMETGVGAAMTATEKEGRRTRGGPRLSRRSRKPTRCWSRRGVGGWCELSAASSP